MRHASVIVFVLVFCGKAWGAEELPRVFDTVFREASKSRVQVSPFLGLYVGDTVSTSFITGSTLTYNWSRHFSTAVDFGYSPLEIDPASAYGSTVTEDRLFHINGALVGVLPGGIKVSHHKVMETDFYGFVGGGWLKMNTSDLWNGFVGIGSLMYFKPWFALRTEARSYLYKLPIARGGFSVDAAILIGPSFLFAPAVF